MLKPAIVLAEAACAKMHGIMLVDALGTWLRSTVPVGELTGNIEEGFGLDGSSIRGWKSVEASGRRDLRSALIARSRRCLAMSLKKEPKTGRKTPVNKS